MARGFGIESLELKATGLFGSALVQFGHCVENPLALTARITRFSLGRQSCDASWYYLQRLQRGLGFVDGK